MRRGLRTALQGAGGGGGAEGQRGHVPGRLVTGRENAPTGRGAPSLRQEGPAQPGCGQAQWRAPCRPELTGADAGTPPCSLGSTPGFRNRSPRAALSHGRETGMQRSSGLQGQNSDRGPRTRLRDSGAPSEELNGQPSVVELQNQTEQTNRW